VILFFVGWEKRIKSSRIFQIFFIFFVKNYDCVLEKRGLVIFLDHAPPICSICGTNFYSRALSKKTTHPQFAAYTPTNFRRTRKAYGVITLPLREGKIFCKKILGGG
jgi:hypothetical protein